MPMREVAYDRDKHGSLCMCGVDLTTLDGGAPAISVWFDEETRDTCHDEACAIDWEAATRDADDAADWYAMAEAR